MNLVKYILDKKGEIYLYDYWITAENEKIPFRCLSDRHLKNIPHYFFKKQESVEYVKSRLSAGILYEIQRRGMEIDYNNECKVVKRNRIEKIIKKNKKRRRFNPYW